MLALILLFLFIALEEISWGQQIFHFSTPEEIAAHNVQSETTLHNLDIFQKSFLLHCFYVIFCLSFAFSKQIIKMIQAKLPKLKNIDFFIVNNSLILYFLIPALFYIHLEFVRPLLIKLLPNIKFLGSSDQEIFELILSVGIILYSVILYKIFKRKLNN
jgi:hypothetical protein